MEALHQCFAQILVPASTIVGKPVQRVLLKITEDQQLLGEGLGTFGSVGYMIDILSTWSQIGGCQFRNFLDIILKIECTSAEFSQTLPI